MNPKKKNSPPLSENKNISIHGDVTDSVIIGDNNTVNQTFFQKVINIFKSDAETLNHCVDLIFLRRVGGGYIFVHRLLMEHFAEMYVETPPQRETKNDLPNRKGYKTKRHKIFPVP
jgi:hypothetical protein